jgi:hypothetical protein
MDLIGDFLPVLQGWNPLGFALSFTVLKLFVSDARRFLALIRESI